MRVAVMGGLLALAAGGGCLGLSADVGTRPPAAANPEWERIWFADRLPPVTAEGVTDANAHAIADALQDELDREGQ